MTYRGYPSLVPRVPLLSLTLSPKKSLFLRVCSKTLWENEQFLLFNTAFSALLEKCLPFSSNLRLSSANSFSLEVYNLSFGKRVKTQSTESPEKLISGPVKKLRNVSHRCISAYVIQPRYLIEDYSKYI